MKLNISANVIWDKGLGISVAIESISWYSSGTNILDDSSAKSFDKCSISRLACRRSRYDY